MGESGGADMHYVWSKDMAGSQTRVHSKCLEDIVEGESVQIDHCTPSYTSELCTASPAALKR